MTYELRIERAIDGPRESVFDAFVDPDAQQLLYADPETPGWTVTSPLDLQVGGKWTIDFRSRHPLEDLVAGRVAI